MNFGILVACFCIAGAITGIFSGMGVTLGGLPTALLYVGAVVVARIWSKKRKEKRDVKKDVKNNDSNEN